MPSTRGFLDRFRASGTPGAAAGAAGLALALVLGKRLGWPKTQMRPHNLPLVMLGAGPRAGVHLMVASRWAALFADRAFVTPDDVQRMLTEHKPDPIDKKLAAEIDRIVEAARRELS